jgi:hypothetical protein
VRGQVRREGRSWPTGYYDGDIERAARLYEHFASFLDEGGTMLQLGVFEDGSPNQGNDVNNFMHAVYTGRYAADRAAAIVARRAEEERQKKRAATLATLKSLVGLKKAA